MHTVRDFAESISKWVEGIPGRELVRKILHLPGSSQGKVWEFQKPLAVATMFLLI